MSHRIIYLFLFVFLLSCTEEQPKPVVKKVKTVKAPPKEEKKVYDLITDENVVERLTAYGEQNPETIVKVYTTKGMLKIKLFKDTPLHRANFILLAKSGYFNKCLFSRVSKKFMAQCGGSYDDLQRAIQDTIGFYTIPAEMSHHHFHKKGAVGAARGYHNNPEKRSECNEFYFVEGMRFSDISLDHYEDENGYKYTPAQRAYYKSNPGAAHIDGEHTVFGQIVEGYAVVPKLTHVETDSRDWPVTDIYIDSVIVVQ